MAGESLCITITIDFWEDSPHIQPDKSNTLHRPLGITQTSTCLSANMLIFTFEWSGTQIGYLYLIVFCALACCMLLRFTKITYKHSTTPSHFMDFLSPVVSYLFNELEWSYRLLMLYHRSKTMLSYCWSSHAYCWHHGQPLCVLLFTSSFKWALVHVQFGQFRQVFTPPRLATRRFVCSDLNCS